MLRCWFVVQAAADEVLDDGVGVVGGWPGDADLAWADAGDGPIDDARARIITGCGFGGQGDAVAVGDRGQPGVGLVGDSSVVILPVALGNGLPLFKDLAKPLRLALAEASSFPDGTVVHVYQPIG